MTTQGCNVVIFLVFILPTLHLTVKSTLALNYTPPSLQELHKVVRNFPSDNAMISDPSTNSRDAKNIALDDSVNEAGEAKPMTNHSKFDSFRERKGKHSLRSRLLHVELVPQDKIPALLTTNDDKTNQEDHRVNSSVIRLDNAQFHNGSMCDKNNKDENEENTRRKRFNYRVTDEHHSLHDKADRPNHVTPTRRRDLMVPPPKMIKEFTTAGRRKRKAASPPVVQPERPATTLSKDVPCETPVCRCNQAKKQAVCLGRTHTIRHMPRVPGYVVTFRLWMASLGQLTREKLGNLSNFVIMRMNLHNNRITSLAKDTFADYTHLKTLDLGGNPIAMAMLKDALYSINSSKFDTLRLDSMFLYDLPNDFLGPFGNRSMKVISIANNNLTVFNAKLFSHLISLDKLVLSGNYISNFVLNNTVYVRKLKLERNALCAVPWFCKPTGDTAFPNLLSLYLAGNPFKRIPAGVFKGRCLPNLLKLDLSSSYLVERLENNFVADLPRLCKLMVGNMKTLQRYSRYCFNSSSMTSLFLAGNKIWTRGTVHKDHIFAHAPNLRVVDLTKTKLDLNPAIDLARILLPAQSLETLRMGSCVIGSLPADIISRLPNLRHLDLTANHVTAFSLAPALRNVTHLHTLILQANKITSVNESTFPPEFRQSIRVLDLSTNDFACTCDLLWFKSWIEFERRSRNVTFQNFPKAFRCRSPDKYRGLLVSSYNPSYRECHPLNIYIVAASVAGVVVLATAVTLAVTYRYRWYLRYYIYRLRRRRNYELLINHDDDDDDEMLYDVYIAYSQFDVDWVVHDLAPLLEASPYVESVFIKDRDQGGGALADNIVKYMDQSARIVLVLSDGYTREGWSGYEFNNVIYAANEQHKDVIVILKGDVEAGRLTKDMRRLLTAGTFLHWGGAEEARGTFRDALRVALNTRGNF